MEQQLQISSLATDTLSGLSASPKYLLSKYFYDDLGSVIFQEIMKMPEYYLTSCEEEIFLNQKEDLCSLFSGGSSSFNLIELGSGDALKTKILLHHLNNNNLKFRYIPIDISQKMNEQLKNTLKNELPKVEVYPHTGDYVQQLQNLNGFAQGRKVILFLGSNIGNFSEDETNWFLDQLNASMIKGDKLVIGFDLKKSPEVIMNAYSDPHGHTRRFNLNLLIRLNRELGADFNTTYFEHHTEYNPLSGEVKSYLISTLFQKVNINSLNQTFYIDKWEPIFVERSQKYDNEKINDLAISHGFRMLKGFYDSKGYFVDVLWEKI